MIKKGKSLDWLDTTADDAIDLAYDHKMDISGSIFRRMTELGMNQSELAEKTGMDRSQISRIITGKQNITIATLAKLEIALSFRLDKGFVYEASTPKRVFSANVNISQAADSRWQDFEGSHTDALSTSHQGFSLYKGAAA